ncbi:putative dimethylarginine dimethylaminohydrolase [Halotydeus destructor]|nr:putative dimethylarginine dimethylaminohydrolase [Halotydeus destructor]
MLGTYGRYTHAIVCRVPDSFNGAIGSSEAINLDEARREHEQYVNILRSLGVDVIELPADDKLPDCPFVEDTAVVANGIALMCRPGHMSRLREVDTMRAILKKELNMPIVEIADKSAKLDGGDVLFTGREFFVGISQRTNEAGARAVAAAFPEFPVSPIRIPQSLLHLKACMSMAGPDILAVSSTPEGQDVLRGIEAQASYQYNTITVADNTGAVVLYVNGTLVHRSEYPETSRVYESRIDYPRMATKIWELSKPQANLTCLSILIKKSRIL